MASKKSIYNLEVMVNESLKEQCSYQIQIGIDAVGYMIYEIGRTGAVSRTMFYGLGAKECNFILKGMQTALMFTKVTQ